MTVSPDKDREPETDIRQPAGARAGPQTKLKCYVS